MLTLKVRFPEMSLVCAFGQSCNAPTRMLVPSSRMDEAAAIAKAAAEQVKVGAPDAEGTTIGQVVPSSIR